MWELISEKRTNLKGKVIVYRMYTKTENGLSKFKYTAITLN